MLGLLRFAVALRLLRAIIKRILRRRLLVAILRGVLGLLWLLWRRLSFALLLWRRLGFLRRWCVLRLLRPILLTLLTLLSLLSLLSLLTVLLLLL